MSFKKIIIGLGLLSVIIPANSCKKFLKVEPVSSFGPDYIFSNVTNATQAVLGVYTALTGDNGYGTRLSLYFAYDDDNIEGQAATPFPDNDRRDIAHYAVTASNAQIDLPFNQLFSGIERANLCIYYIPKMALYNSTTDPVSSAQLHRLYGESLTLRAQFYLELIRNWGDVPAQFSPTFTQTNLEPGKTDRDTIYNHLLNDLQIAEQIVPWRTDPTATGDSRITCGAVRALRARIALYRAGWSLRQSGIMMQGSDPMTYYKIAMSECDTVMSHTADHSLDPSYKDIFQKLDNGLVDNSYGEVIWQVTFGGGTGATDSKLGYYCGPTLVSASSKGNAALTPLPCYFFLFDSTDVRRDVTIAPYDITNATGALTVLALHKLNLGKFRRDWMSQNIEYGTAQYFGASWPIIRLSDVYLMYAEADNEVNGGPSGKAITALQAVSARGHGGNSSLAVVPPTDHDGFFKAVFKERSLELGGEGQRKYDLIRTNQLGTALAYTKQVLKDMTIPTDDAYAPWTHYATYVNYDQTNSVAGAGVKWTSSFYATGNTSGVQWLSNGGITGSILAEYGIDFTPNKSELLPIPQVAIDANPNLKQNPNY